MYKIESSCGCGEFGIPMFVEFMCSFIGVGGGLSVFACYVERVRLSFFCGPAGKPVFQIVGFVVVVVVVWLVVVSVVVLGSLFGKLNGELLEVVV